MEPNIRIKGFDGDWEERSLGDIYTERNERGNDSLQILSVSIHDGVSDGELDEEGLGKVVRRSEDKSTYKHVYEGDLVFNMMRAWQGAIGVVKTEGMISPAYISAIPNASVYPPFMDYVLRRKEAIDQINNLSYGVTDFRKRLYWDSFVKVKCHRPSVEEQKRITDTLESLDRYTLLNQRQCDDLRELKKYMLQKMFPKDGEKVPEIRFSGFEGEWEQRKFGEITELKSASRVHKEEWTSSGVPFYRSSDVMSAINGIENEKAFISVELYEKLSSVSGKLEKGDVLITGGGSVGNPYIVLNNEPLYTKDADLLWIKNQGRFDEYFIYEFFFSPAFRNYLSSISHVGTIAHYTITQLSDTPVSLPSKGEQKKIGAYFSQLDSLITHHQRKHDTLLEFKAYLLQNMFPKEG